MIFNTVRKFRARRSVANLGYGIVTGYKNIQESQNRLRANLLGEHPWSPHSWRAKPIAQNVDFDPSALKAVTSTLSSLPALVSYHEVESCKEALKHVANGSAFLLQAGDCAERFADCNDDHIRRRIDIIKAMAFLIGYSLKKPVLPIGRMAGQYAKPRSQLFETLVSGEKIPAFRGENINDFAAQNNLRQPDAQRLLMSYHYASSTLNFMRLQRRYDGSHAINEYMHLLDHIPKDLNWARYRRVIQEFKEFWKTLESMRAFANFHDPHTFDTVLPQQVYVSHEALVLPYEESLTRFIPDTGRWYNLGAHFLWIGDRTRDIDGAHIEYCRGVSNPIGIKIGHQFNIHDLEPLLRSINPCNEPGKVTLITRFGLEKCQAGLGQLIARAKEIGCNVGWSVDPMHGNTRLTAEGRKTRDLATITEEVSVAHRLHRSLGTELSGIHLELTPDAVTECTGGIYNLQDQHLWERYETLCDPRLNPNQSLEVALHLASFAENSSTHH
jgi:3-deoxy-7-phosphoheptulonate synthase